MDYWYQDEEMRNTLRSMGASGIQELFGFFVSPRVIIGEVGLKFFGIVASVFCDDQKAFFVSGETTKKYAEEVGETIEESGFEYKIWTSEEPEAPLSSIKECAEEMREYEPDIIIPVGGGSRIDLAKMAWILYERPDADLKDVNPLVPLGLRNKAVMAAFPTTAGTGSEITWAAVGSDKSVEPSRKLEVSSLEIVPDFAILVPRFTAGMPPYLTAGSGLDALAHAFGAYLCTYSNEFTDPLALQSIKMIFDWLPTVYKQPDNMEARHKMLTASAIAGLAFGNSQTALTHSLGHAVGKAFDLHHGVSVGLFIPYSLQFYSKTTDKYVDMARYLGIEADSKEGYLNKLDQKFKDLMNELDISYALKDHDIDKDEWEENLDQVTSYACEDVCTLPSPRPTSEPELKKVLNYAYEGKDIDF